MHAYVSAQLTTEQLRNSKLLEQQTEKENKPYKTKQKTKTNENVTIKRDQRKDVRETAGKLTSSMYCFL
jgi:hypothetical protein